MICEMNLSLTEVQGNRRPGFLEGHRQSRRELRHPDVGAASPWIASAKRPRNDVTGVGRAYGTRVG